MSNEDEMRAAYGRVKNKPRKRQIGVEDQTMIDAFRRVRERQTLDQMSPDMIRNADVAGVRLQELEKLDQRQRAAVKDRAREQGLYAGRPSDSTALGVVNSIAQVPTATFGDELTGYITGGAAAAESYLTGEGDPADRFSAGQQYALQETRQSMDNLPVGARIAIETATAVPVGMAMKGMGVIANAGSKAKRARNVMGTAAGGGAVAGFGSGEDGFASRVQNAVLGATMGATLGAVGVGFSGLVKSAVRKVSAGRQGTLSAGEKKAYDAVIEAFERDGIPLEEAQARLARWRQDGVPGMLMDMGGDHVRGIAEYAAARPNAYNMAKSVLRERAAGAKGRIDAKLSDMLGNGAEYAESLKALRDLRSQSASPLYDAAFEAGIRDGKEDVLKEMTTILQRPSGQKAQQRAVSIAKEKGVDFEELSFLEKMHFYKLGLDDVAYAAKRSTEESSAGNVMRGAQEDTARRFRELLYDASPEYETAANKYASDSEIIDALQTGREVFSSKGGQMAEDIAEYVAGLSDAGKEAYRLGVAREIRLKMQTTKDGADSLKRWFNTDEWRERMRPAFDSEVAFKRFTKAMHRETMIRRALDETIGNSATARREAGQGIFSDEKTPIRDFAESALNLDAGRAIRDTARAVGKNVEERRMNATAEGVVNALLNPSQEATDQIVNRLLRQRALQQPQGVERGNALMMGALPVITGQ